jgi:cytochrome c2
VERKVTGMIRVPLMIALIVALLPLTVYAGDVEHGKRLFKKHCKSCHRLTEGVIMGPSLKGVTQRVSEAWIDKWIQDPKAVIEGGDPYAIKLVKKFKKIMPKKSAMGDPKNRDDIISFLKSVD